jgi:Protein of unknown function (DUF3558)
MVLIAGVVLLDMTAGACSSGKEPGTPAAASSVAASSAVASSAVTPAPSSGRPVVLPLDGVSPCDLVTDAMRQQFKIDRPDAPNNDDRNMPRCILITTTVGQYLVAAVRNQGVEALGRPVTTTVAGFPAVEIQRPNIKIGHLSVDVADGQRLDIEVQRLNSSQPVDEVYRDTRIFAEAVLATLRQKLGR